MGVAPWSLLIILIFSVVTEGYKILAVFPLPGKSHVILSDGLMRHLLEAGHEVTYITPSPRNNTPPNLRQIDVSENFQRAIKDEILSLNEIMNTGLKLGLTQGFDNILAIYNNTFHYPQVLKVLLDPQEKFDVVIAEWMFSELYSGFAAIVNAPLIWVSTVDPHWMILSLIDENTNPAYTSDIFSSKIPPFTFLERIEQLILQVIGYTITNYYIRPKEREIYASIIPYIKHRNNTVLDYDELRYIGCLVLGNSHVSMGSAMSLPQSYKPVGGYHIDDDVKPLPKDLQKIMDNAKHGVIYFSMGSMLKSNSLPDEVKQNLLKIFSSLKQTVIWKFEEVLLDLSDNVHILQWAPQPSILAHPNCVLFITHGGLLSSTEAIYFGKPVIGIPVFADQFLNVERAVKLGFAKKVDLSFTIAADLKEAIDEIIGNSSYSKKAKKLSFIYHHRPVLPGKEVVHWVEHVIETDGAPHLRSPALQVPFYQKLFLDLAVIMLITLIVIKKIVAFVLSAFKNKKVENEKKLN